MVAWRLSINHDRNLTPIFKYFTKFKQNIFKNVLLLENQLLSFANRKKEMINFAFAGVYMLFHFHWHY